MSEDTARRIEEVRKQLQHFLDQKLDPYTFDLDNELPKRRLIGAIFENEDGTQHRFKKVDGRWEEADN